MYRISPFTYLVGGFLATGIANTAVTCADNEFLTFQPGQAGQTCIDYMRDYIADFGGYLQNDQATSDCQYCSYDDSNVFLQSVNIDYADRWRNFGILWAFIIFNIFAAVFFYWLVRVPKKAGRGKKEKKA